jgi:hypothetical protein
LDPSSISRQQLASLSALSAFAKRPDTVADVFGGPAGLQCVAEAEKISVCVLLFELDEKKEKIVRQWESDYRTLSKEDTASVKRALLAPATYLFDSVKGCRPVDYVRMKIKSATDELLIDYCPMCEVLAVSRAGVYLGGEDYDGAADLFGPLFLRIFPTDEILLKTEAMRIKQKERRANQPAQTTPGSSAPLRV